MAPARPPAYIDVGEFCPGHHHDWPAGASRPGRAAAGSGAGGQVRGLRLRPRSVGGAGGAASRCAATAARCGPAAGPPPPRHSPVCSGVCGCCACGFRAGVRGSGLAGDRGLQGFPVQGVQDGQDVAPCCGRCRCSCGCRGGPGWVVAGQPAGTFCWVFSGAPARWFVGHRRCRGVSVARVAALRCPAGALGVSGRGRGTSAGAVSRGGCARGSRCRRGRAALVAGLVRAWSCGRSAPRPGPGWPARLRHAVARRPGAGVSTCVGVPSGRPRPAAGSRPSVRAGAGAGPLGAPALFSPAPAPSPPPRRVARLRSPAPRAPRRRGPADSPASRAPPLHRGCRGAPARRAPAPGAAAPPRARSPLLFAPPPPPPPFPPSPPPRRPFRRVRAPPARAAPASSWASGPLCARPLRRRRLRRARLCAASPTSRPARSCPALRVSSPRRRAPPGPPAVLAVPLPSLSSLSLFSFKFSHPFSHFFFFFFFSLSACTQRRLGSPSSLAVAPLFSRVLHLFDAVLAPTLLPISPLRFSTTLPPFYPPHLPPPLSPPSRR